MGRRIYKYELKAQEPASKGYIVSRIGMPEGARILKLGTQGNRPVVWAVVDPEAPIEERVFLPFPTGEALGEGVDIDAYIGTFQLDSMLGNLVFHVFELVREA